jgi:hypothetical protein
LCLRFGEKSIIVVTNSSELSEPIQFEPVGQKTAVFYDVKNQQVFRTFSFLPFF